MVKTAESDSKGPHRPRRISVVSNFIHRIDIETAFDRPNVLRYAGIVHDKDFDTATHARSTWSLPRLFPRPTRRAVFPSWTRGSPSGYWPVRAPNRKALVIDSPGDQTIACIATTARRQPRSSTCSSALNTSPTTVPS